MAQFCNDCGTQLNPVAKFCGVCRATVQAARHPSEKAPSSVATRRYLPAFSTRLVAPPLALEPTPQV